MKKYKTLLDKKDEIDRLILEYAESGEMKVGVVGVKKVLAAAYNRFTGQGDKSNYFDTLQVAKDFLVE